VTDLTERLLDHAARALGVDSHELRAAAPTTGGEPLRLTYGDLPRLQVGQPLLLDCGTDSEPAQVRVVDVESHSVAVTSDVFLAAVPDGSTRHTPAELLWPQEVTD
jgi:hypothetical protein